MPSSKIRREGGCGWWACNVANRRWRKGSGCKLIAAWTSEPIVQGCRRMHANKGLPEVPRTPSPCCHVLSTFRDLASETWRGCATAGRCHD
jgi:hypothetical protein